MLIEEARWLGRWLACAEPSAISPVCNLGSASEDFRMLGQPWTDDLIFRPLRERGHLVKHVDMDVGPGVDLQGDLLEDRFLQELSRFGFRTVLCCNLLEHVPDRARLAAAVVDLTAPGGYILASCPFEYPYHPDPIDTLYRPTVAELSALFPGTTPLAGEVVTCGTYWDYATRTSSHLAKTIGRLCLPFYRTQEWYGSMMHLGWLLRNFKATCVVLRKPSGPRAQDPSLLRVSTSISIEG